MKPDLKRVAVLTFEGMAAYEFSCALEIFALPRPEIDHAYHCEALSIDNATVASTGGIQISVARNITALEEFGTVVVPGWPLSRNSVPDILKQSLLALHQQGGRLVSICSGAFLFAQVGLLDGKQATTHWRYAEAFKQRFPKVDYQGDVLYTEDERIFTSAGSSAGLDLCLHIVRKDLGYRKANKVARRLVMPPQRSGGQAQYVEAPVAAQHNHLSDTLAWAVSNIEHEITIDELAKRACVSRRSFDRQFRNNMDMSPKQWLIQKRIERASELLESTQLDIEQVAHQSGFDKAINLRHHFKIHKGIAPAQYRAEFGIGAPASG